MKEKTIYKNLWDSVKIVLRQRFIALNAYIRRISSRSFYLRKLEKEKQIKFKVNRRKEIVKMIEINL